jgi:hypothetical protein
MSKIFVPYCENSPAALNIKGHRLLILSSSSEQLNNYLEEMGGTHIKAIDLFEDENEVLAQLAASIDGGIVISPPEESIEDIVRNLEDQLPWVH